MNLLDFCNAYLLGVGVPLALIGVGLFFAVRLHAFPLLHPERVLRAVLRRRRSDGISPLRALSMALAGVLGVGNLVGVSAALAAGGAGAIFWMWVSATVAMPIKYAEIVLAIRHRDGEYGGAIAYIRAAFGGRRAWLGRLLGLIFAALCLVDALSMGCVVQINAVASAWQGLGGIPNWLTGAVLAAVVWLAGVGGARRVSGWTERLIPTVTLGFVAVSLAAIATRWTEIPTRFSEIVGAAFSADGMGRSALGGIGGFLLSRALRFGTMRGLLSNEAGCGTSPMAHATADTDDAAAQGCLGIVEVFVDTHLLCTMTALVVLMAWDEVCALGDAPMRMTMRAYETLLGGWAGAFLGVAVLLFGLATLLCWSHYAVESCRALVGERHRHGALVRYGTLAVYCAFCVVGATVAPSAVWAVADFAIGSMTLINLGVLCRLHGEVESASRRLMCRASKKERPSR